MAAHSWAGSIRGRFLQRMGVAGLLQVGKDKWKVKKHHHHGETAIEKMALGILSEVVLAQQSACRTYDQTDSVAIR
ncbi:hypothetical protein [Pseudomonas mucidolens]